MDPKVHRYAWTNKTSSTSFPCPQPTEREEMTNAMSVPDRSNFRDLLVDDHERLDVMLASILELARGDSQAELIGVWGVYEDALLAHLDAEEMFLLPGLVEHDPVLGAGIGEDHAKIRSFLADVGVGLELHIVREERMLELARFLRAHAKLEEQPLYLWANQALPEGYFASVSRRLVKQLLRWVSPSPTVQTPPREVVHF